MRFGHGRGHNRVMGLIDWLFAVLIGGSLLIVIVLGAANAKVGDDITNETNRLYPRNGRRP